MAFLAGLWFVPSQAAVRVLRMQMLAPGPDRKRGCRLAGRVKLHVTAQDRHAHRLRIPRRPAWDRGTSPEELDVRERAAFLAWRRDLAQCAAQLA